MVDFEGIAEEREMRAREYDLDHYQGIVKVAMRTEGQKDEREEMGVVQTRVTCTETCEKYF